MIVEGITVCKPIEELVNYFLKNNFEIIESRVNDYHFNELYFKLKGKYFDAIEDIKISGIIKEKNDFFLCECNWSIVKLDYV